MNRIVTAAALAAAFWAVKRWFDYRRARIATAPHETDSLGERRRSPRAASRGTRDLAGPARNGDVLSYCGRRPFGVQHREAKSASDSRNASAMCVYRTVPDGH